MASTSYLPLDLSKSKKKYRSTSDDRNRERIPVSREIYSPLMALQSRYSSISSSKGLEHNITKYSINKDRSCSLSWSSMFGAAIPTTTIPGDLPALQRRGFVAPPPHGRLKAEDTTTPVQNGINSHREFFPAPSSIFPRYGVPLPASLTPTYSDVIPAHLRRLQENACPVYCCCSNVHSAPEFDATRMVTDYITPSLTFDNAYRIDSRNAITSLRRDYTVPSAHSPTRGASPKAYSYTETEPFYDHVPKRHRHEAMYYRPKDVCELWKYQGERIGYLPSNGSRLKQFTNADDKKQTIKEGIPLNRESDNSVQDTIDHARIDEKSEDVGLLMIRPKDILKEENSDTINISKSSNKSIDEKKEKPYDDNVMSSEHCSAMEKNVNEGNSAHYRHCSALEKKVNEGNSVHSRHCSALEKNVNEGSSAHSRSLVRLKSKDAIGPGYIEMIAKAILNSKSKRCMLTDIYKYISTTYSRYRDDTVCWRNIVRHHLSHYECFVKAEHNGHAHYWTINPEMEQDFINGKFHRKRRPNRRKRTVSSTNIISDKSTLDSVVTSPVAHWFPSTFHPYYQDKPVKPYVFVHGQPWLNQDPLRGCYPYLLDANLSRPPFEKCYR